ncbi:uncharacterized protein LOC127115741 [Lathyrus oleraceus]|uniref:Defensin-like protein n=1 Tax=Pisum sativum TaxID=3888 RepID=A0A9D5BLL1_PEA|nr:uncharacterized protein LOC127115741 [Pisum sativum]KAI5445692.1 hypothetical protein KIW84_013787 [Pisum sativum]
MANSFIFFVILASIAAAPFITLLRVEAGMCSLVSEKCNERNCEQYCKSQVNDGKLSWFCDSYNLCTCVYNIDNSKHAQRCSMGVGSCNGGKPDCDSKCASKYPNRDHIGVCFDYFNGTKMCVCTYAS